MRIIKVIIAIVASVVAARGDIVRDCDDMLWIVSNLTDGDAFEELLTMHDCWSHLIPVLISQLKPVDELVIRSSYCDKYKNALNVVWSIRALRYITGVDFYGTALSFDYDDEIRGDLLTKNGDLNKTPFFATWMSRDYIYFSDMHVQEQIIKKWKNALKEGIQVRSASQKRSIDDWYF
jgi:hypothetical protein